MELTDQAMSYGGAPRGSSVEVRNNPLAAPKPAAEAAPARASAEATAAAWPMRADGKPDFDNMTAAQRVAYHEWRLKRVFG